MLSIMLICVMEIITFTYRDGRAIGNYIIYTSMNIYLLSCVRDKVLHQSPNYFSSGFDEFI